MHRNRRRERSLRILQKSVEKDLRAAGYSEQYTNEVQRSRRRRLPNRSLSQDDTKDITDTLTQSNDEHNSLQELRSISLDDAVNERSGQHRAEEAKEAISESKSAKDVTTKSRSASLQIPMGESMRLSARASNDPSQWAEAIKEYEADKFSIREWGYRDSKQKVKSGDAMFSLAAVDCVLSSGAIHHFSERIKLPSLPSNGYSNTVPPYFIINMQIPRRAKALFGGRNGDPIPTMNSVYYFVQTEKTRLALSRLEMYYKNGGDQNAVSVDGVPPSICLLHRWCAHANNDRVLNGAFKAIGVGFNFKEAGAPPFVKSFNGKPVLMAHNGPKEKREGFVNIYRDENGKYLECDVDMAAHFSFLAQKGLVWGINKSHKLDCALAFLIEGRSNPDLPECVLGCVQQRYVSVEDAIDESDIFTAPFDRDYWEAEIQLKFGEKFGAPMASFLSSQSINSIEELQSISSDAEDLLNAARQCRQLKQIQVSRLREWLQTLSKQT